jgi:CelD/BcsL family acetyltransferase involved in cellulose biosynthesis
MQAHKVQSKSSRGNGDASQIVLTSEIIRDIDNFSAIQASWNQLVILSRGTIFQTFEWQYYWWKHFGENTHRALNIIIFRYAGDLVGIVPLYEEVHRIFGYNYARSLRFMGAGVWNSDSLDTMTYYGPSDFLDAIIHPDYTMVVLKNLLSLLKKSDPSYEEIVFEHVPTGSALLNLDIQGKNEINYTLDIRRADVCPRLRLSGTLDQYLNNLKASVRRRFSQSLKAANDVFSIEIANSLEVFEKYFGELIQLHQKRWNRIGFPGLFDNKRFESFQYEVLKTFYTNGWLWCGAVTFRDQTIAVRIALRTKYCFYDYLSGFNEDSMVSKHRPGIALVLTMIKDAIEAGIETIEFLRGDESYKFDFTSDVSYNWKIVLAKKQDLNFIHRLCYKVLKIFRFVHLSLVRETTLLSIQRREHGATHFIKQYLIFRLSRLSRKYQHTENMDTKKKSVL